jgi:hypothetical protein
MGDLRAEEIVEEQGEVLQEEEGLRVGKEIEWQPTGST